MSRAPTKVWLLMEADLDLIRQADEPEDLIYGVYATEEAAQKARATMIEGEDQGETLVIAAWTVAP